MLIKKHNSLIIATEYNREILTLVDSEDWSIWLKRVRDLSSNTILSFMKSMAKFWEWSLYNPIGVDETFPSYQARYRVSLLDGFEITVKNYDDMLSDFIHTTILSSKPLKKVTVNKEIAGINSYFYFTEESKLIEDHRFINYLHEKHKSSTSFLAGIQIRKSSIAQEAHGTYKKYLPPYKVVRNRQRIKYFPLELFDELLAVAKPRERLLYLLCGACSARIGQALNITLYDIDYDSQEVWLIDPKSDDRDIYGNRRRVWLKEEYGIDMTIEGEHNTPDLQFKYPIPRYHEPIYWLSDKYKDLFFNTLGEYTRSKEYIPELVRFPKHPFLFTTKSGKRVHARDALSRFKNTLQNHLYLQNPKEEHRILLDIGFHSLRHMFGHARAELYARARNDSIPYITMNEMGHSNFESTLVYFNLSRETIKELITQYTNEQSNPTQGANREIKQLTN